MQSKKMIVISALSKEKAAVSKEKDVTEIGTAQRVQLENKIDNLHEMISKFNEISEQEFETFMKLNDRQIRTLLEYKPKFILGDTIYILNENDRKIKKGIINQISIEKHGIAYYADIYSFTDDDIGVDVFGDELSVEEKIKNL